MKNTHVFSLTLLVATALAGCSTTPPNNAMLDQARSDYRMVQANPQAQNYAAVELKQASDALGKADEAFTRKDDSKAVDQLAYLAKQRSALAQEVINCKAAEANVAQASAERDQLRLAARTREADAALQSATVAQREAQMSQRQSEAAQRDAMAAQQQAAQSQQLAAASQQQAGDADQRARALEAQLRDLNAKKTDRGMVITIGDVLFDSGKADLKSGGMRSVEKLSGFLKEYPQRKAMIEGYTDSTGSDSLNQQLSGRRADAVRAALIGMGVGMDRLATHGYGVANPVAGNDSAGGRQMNRRVEVVLSDESGVIAAPR